MLASVVVAAAAGGTIPATVVTRNDAAAPRNETTPNDNDDNDNDDDDAKEDPYDNLPDEDEPTHCSICNVYRQGPCRPYWRKVERCTKDHELPKKKESDDHDDDDSSNSAQQQPVCFKYMMPWIECASGYRGLYALIEMDTNYALGIADLEEETNTSHQVLCWNPKSPDYPVKVDWSEWQIYIQKQLDEGNNEDGYHGWTGPTAAIVADEPLSSSSVNPKGTSLWKTLPVTKPSDDPVLIPIEATIPRMEHDGIGVLECAYALDQQGNVLGFVYGSHGSPSKKSSSSNEEPNNDKDTKSTTTTAMTAEEEEKEPVVPTTTLTIRLMPSHTSHITIGASYVRPGQNEPEKDNEPTNKQGDKATTTTTTSNNKKETDDANDKSYTRLYKTRPLSLLEQAHAATQSSTNH
jgi:hypothetical protein